MASEMRQIQGVPSLSIEIQETQRTALVPNARGIRSQVDRYVLPLALIVISKVTITASWISCGVSSLGYSMTRTSEYNRAANLIGLRFAREYSECGSSDETCKAVALNRRWVSTLRIQRELDSASKKDLTFLMPLCAFSILTTVPAALTIIKMQEQENTPSLALRTTTALGAVGCVASASAAAASGYALSSVAVFAMGTSVFALAVAPRATTRLINRVYQAVSNCFPARRLFASCVKQS